MAKIIKLVDRIVPSIERAQVFTNTDALTGDILDFMASLGRPARKVTIETGGGSDLTTRKNVVQMIYPLRENDIFSGPLGTGDSNLAQGVEKIDDTMGALDSTPSLTLDGPVKDLEVTWSAGTWEITVY